MDKIRNLCIILGDQLNHNSSILSDFDSKKDMVWMAEVMSESVNPLSSKQRTTLFFSAMRHFSEELKQKRIKVEYIEINDGIKNFVDALEKTIANYDIGCFQCVIPGDIRVYKLLSDFFKEKEKNIEWLEDTHFIAKKSEFDEWIKKYKKPRMEYWYRYIRKSRKVLLGDNEKPIGGKWNLDFLNRKSFDKSGPQLTQKPLRFKPDEITKKVIIDIEKKLPNLPGHVSKFDWAVTRKQALKVLDDFIEFRLSLYGDYQDAMWMKEPWLYHSMISSCLNLKLLNPEEVIKAVEQAYYKNKAPLNAAEGFIRQIIGWREYIHGLYWFYSDVWMNSNALKAKRALPNFYWTGKTKMTCINESVNQVIEYGYSHHIQRLMVTGLFSLLYGVKPSEIHTWYLSMFVDAVAWTEVPNTIGMSQYADGGIVGSKPYIASGAYISRMSNYCKNCNYEPTKASEENACPFTTLYWYFVYKNRSLLKNNPRLSMQIKNWDRKEKKIQKEIIKRSKKLFNNVELF